MDQRWKYLRFLHRSFLQSELSPNWPPPDFYCALYWFDRMIWQATAFESHAVQRPIVQRPQPVAKNRFAATRPQLVHCWPNAPSSANALSPNPASTDFAGRNRKRNRRMFLEFFALFRANAQMVIIARGWPVGKRRDPLGIRWGATFRGSVVFLITNALPDFNAKEWLVFIRESNICNFNVRPLGVARPDIFAPIWLVIKEIDIVAPLSYLTGCLFFLV